jgi:hypothetical protein
MTTVQSTIAECRAEASRLAALLEIYPDLQQATNRWRRVFHCSKSVNAVATDFEMGYSCSCCPDPELYVRVFVDTQHGRVYGVPYQISIGERDGIDYPADAWDDILRDHGIQAGIIDRLKQHFDNQISSDTNI